MPETPSTGPAPDDGAPAGSLQEQGSGLLGPSDVRDLCGALGIRPTKTLGQNFVHDAGTVRRIVRSSGVRPGQTVLEIGPGLGSLTLAILEAGSRVVAVEIDPPLARALPVTVADRMPQASQRLKVVPVAITHEQLPAGVVDARKREVLVGTADRAVRLGEVTPLGKKPMPAADWARGVRIDADERLGEETA